MAQTPRRGRPAVVANARARILAEAARLFATRGYDNTSISDLAEVLGLTKPAIYHYFPSKRAIYDEIILQILSGQTAAVAEAIATIPPGAARVRRFMMAHAAFFEANFWGFSAMLVGYGGMNPQILGEAVALRDGYERMFREVLTGAVAAGELRPLDVVTTGRAMLSTLNWMTRWFRPGGGRTAEEIAADYFDLFFSGLAARSD